MTPESRPTFDVVGQVVSFTFLAESRQLVIILAGGDIAVLGVDESPGSSEVRRSIIPLE